MLRVLILSVLFITSLKRYSFRDAFFRTWYAFLDSFQEPYPLVNGVKASKSQLRLAEALGVPEECINYKVGSRYIDIVLPHQKIAIEYNGALYHQDKSRDLQRAQELVQYGWKVLIIQVHNGFPNPYWVKGHIKRLQKYKRKKILYVEWK